MACDVALYHFPFLERKEVKLRKKEVVAPLLTSVTA